MRLLLTSLLLTVLPFLLCAMTTGYFIPPALAASLGYKVVKTSPLPGPVHWDYLTFDETGNQLFIARGDRVDAVDTNTMTLKCSIVDKGGLHGVALAHDLGKGFISNGKTATVQVFNLSDLKPTTRVPASDDADAIAYDEKTHRVFTANGDANSLSVIDAKKNKNIASVPLLGKPEYEVLDTHGKLFVNIADKGELVAIDTTSLKILARYDLKPDCTEPTGLAIDQQQERLFLGCRNETMVIVDGNSGKTITTLPIGKFNDATKYDEKRKLAFASNGDGSLTIVEQTGPDAYKVKETVETLQGARTMALDPGTGTVYLTSATVDHIDPPTKEHPHPHPQYKEGSFVVLTVRGE